MIIDLPHTEQREAQILQIAHRIKAASELPRSEERNAELAALSAKLGELVAA